MPAKSIPSVHERLQEAGARALSDAELLTIVLGPTAGANSTRDAALALLDARQLSEIAWASPEELQQHSGIGPARAAAIVAAFELGRRGAWAPPKRGERVLDPARVYELLRHPARPCGCTSRGQPHPCGVRVVSSAPISRCRFCALPAIHDAITPGPQFGEVHRTCFIAWDREQEAMELEFGRAAFVPGPTDFDVELETDSAPARRPDHETTGLHRLRTFSDAP